MPSFASKLHKLALALLASCFSPQVGMAGHGGGGGHMSQGGGGHFNVSGPFSNGAMRNGPLRQIAPIRGSGILGKNQNKPANNVPSNKVTPAKNGNTGITGSGLPQKNNSGGSNKTVQTAKPNLPPSKSDFLSKVGVTSKPGSVNNGTAVGPTAAKAAQGNTISKTGSNAPINGNFAKGNGPSANTHQASQHHGHHHQGLGLIPIGMGLGLFPSAFGSGYQQNTYNPVIISPPPTPVADAAAPATDAAPPAADGSAPTPSPASTPGPAATATNAPVQLANSKAADKIDLVLEAVQMVEPASETAGPSYRVRFRNEGTQTAGPFRVAAFAELNGNLTENISRAIEEVAGLSPGETSEVTLRLPLTAMAMVSDPSSEPEAFNKLSVSVDLDSTVPEVDKANNVATVDCAVLQVATK